MANTMTKTMKGAAGEAGLASLLGRLVEEKRRLERLLQEVDEVLRKASPSPKAATGANREAAPPRPSPLDQVKGVMAATADLRVAKGNLSAERVAQLFGVSLSQLAAWLGRSRQALSKTPDADSLQNGLAFFEHLARMRVVVPDAEFRKWLRMPNELLGNRSPLDVMAKGEWQLMADYVDDALTGAPT
jgi:Protein of unknown function (DUF2384)